MRRILGPTTSLAALLAVVTLAALLVPVTPVAVAGVACIGAPSNDPADAYSEQRQFVETQTWWTPDSSQTGTNQGHVHLGACIPERETLRTNFTMHVRAIMHDNSGKGNYMSMVFKGPNYETTVQKLSLDGMTCPLGTCEKWLTFTGNLASFRQAGLQEIRFRAFVPEPSVADARHLPQGRDQAGERHLTSTSPGTTSRTSPRRAGLSRWQPAREQPAKLAQAVPAFGSLVFIGGSTLSVIVSITTLLGSRTELAAGTERLTREKLDKLRLLCGQVMDEHRRVEGHLRQAP